MSGAQADFRHIPSRHGYASLLIGSGLDVVFVSRQLGHAKADVTLRVYAHLLARREHAERAKVALSAGYAAVAAAGRGWGSLLKLGCLGGQAARGLLAWLGAG